MTFPACCRFCLIFAVLLYHATKTQCTSERTHPNQLEFANVYNTTGQLHHPNTCISSGVTQPALAKSGMLDKRRYLNLVHTHWLEHTDWTQGRSSLLLAQIHSKSQFSPFPASRYVPSWTLSEFFIMQYASETTMKHNDNNMWWVIYLIELVRKFQCILISWDNCNQLIFFLALVILVMIAATMTRWDFVNNSG